jgi:EAL domain-containing protein (putative c-di-GMP-specific phosphodiesterase class I)
MRRLGPPICCGLIGILITIVIGNIPHSYSSFLFSGFLITFIMAHVLWFHKIIQSLRQDLKRATEPSRVVSPHPSLAPLGEEQTHELLIEAAFFQLLREGLAIDHPPHIQARSLQDNKAHLIQTNSLIALLKENQLEILAQPIVNLPQKRLTFFSCIPCVTMENGMLINLNTLRESSNNVASNQAIDRMILFQTLQFVRRHHATHPYHGFICSLPGTIYKDHHFLEEMGNYLHKSHFPFQSLILEVPLDIQEAVFTNLLQLGRYGVRFIGKWQNKALPKNLAELVIPSVDFIMLPYGELSGWQKSQPRRQSIESLQQILEISPQIIISDVHQEQELYHNLPLPFDYALGDAFGIAKPFYHIQV